MTSGRALGLRCVVVSAWVLVVLAALIALAAAFGAYRLARRPRGRR